MAILENHIFRTLPLRSKLAKMLQMKVMFMKIKLNLRVKIDFETSYFAN